MATSYLDYAMSVIVSRALPDARDGLKPVHRRILFGMDEAGYHHDRPYRKAARVVGDVMGKYHPHGDQAIYDAMVRMAQDFSMRLPLIDGQGNFGSMDGDPPAAMRYTEVRLDRAARALLDDIDRDTVDFQANYDDTAREPTVLPARIPNLLVNGAGGIAVGMATNIPPHNLGELIDACFAYLDDPDIDVDGLMAHVKAPDFPTGALILGESGARSAYATGRGSIVMRARTHDRGGGPRPPGDRGDRDPLPGQQGAHDRADRRGRARQAGRGDRRAARRIGPPGHSRGHRDPARGQPRDRAQPALPPHAAADQLRRQHAGARPWPARDADPQIPDQGVRRLPPGGRDPAHPVRSRQGARARRDPGRAWPPPSPISTPSSP